MKLTKLILTLLLILNSNNLFGQGIQWQNTIGGNAGDDFTSIQETSDKGYICGGWSSSDTTGDHSELSHQVDYWIVKLDTLGNIEWENSIGGSSVDRLKRVQQTTNGGYICGGTSSSNASWDKSENSFGYSDYWVIMLDSIGNIVWQNSFGGNGSDDLISIQQTSDEGFICGGISDSPISGNKTENSQGEVDFWVVKLDSLGIIEWENTIGGDSADWFTSIIQTPEGGYICTGYTKSNISGDKTDSCLGDYDYWLIKLDSIGNIEWQRTIGGYGKDFPSSIIPTAEGGYMFGGYSRSNISGDKTENCLGGEDFWLLKLSSTGVIEWQNTIGGIGYEVLKSIEQTIDSGYLCIGYSSSTISGDILENTFGRSDYWILKLDSVGNIQWQNMIGGTYYDQECQGQQTADGGYIIGGKSSSTISGDKIESCWGFSDYWIIKLCINSYSNFSIIACESFMSPSGNISWTQSGIYTDTLVSATGCDSIISINLTILNIPTVQFTGDSLICFGDTTVLSITQPFYSYNWSSGDTSASIEVSQSGLYSIIVTDTNGCQDSLFINVSVLPYPIVNITAQGPITFCQGDSVILSGTTGLSSYQWYRRNYAIPGATLENYVAKSEGRYKCIAQNAALCSDTSNTIIVNVPCISIGPNQERTELLSDLEFKTFQVFPNPTNGIFTIESPPGFLQIFNSVGKLVYAKYLILEENAFDFSYFPNGIYFARLETEENIFSQKIVLSSYNKDE